MSNKRQEVEAAIKKAVPEIETAMTVCPACLGSGSPDPEHYDVPCVCPGSVGTYKGRPITLEDVLRAIEQTKYRYTFCMAEAVTSTPSAIYVYDFNEHIAMMPWVLGKPLSEQSDDVINLLHSILV